MNSTPNVPIGARSALGIVSAQRDNGAVRTEAALLWRRILTADPDAIFGTEASRLMNRDSGADRSPQPGYMGLRYRPGGLMFVSMNPGAGPQDGVGPDDRPSMRPCNACGMPMNPQPWPRSMN